MAARARRRRRSGERQRQHWRSVWRHSVTQSVSGRGRGAARRPTLADEALWPHTADDSPSPPARHTTTPTTATATPSTPSAARLHLRPLGSSLGVSLGGDHPATPPMPCEREVRDRGSEAASPRKVPQQRRRRLAGRPRLHVGSQSDAEDRKGLITKIIMFYCEKTHQ